MVNPGTLPCLVLHLAVDCIQTKQNKVSAAVLSFKLTFEVLRGILKVYLYIY